jgi:calcineurin-like phosphoesterase
VQTADNVLLPRGTAYITDLGMTRAQDSVLGVKKEIIIDRFVNAMPQKFEHADGKAMLCGALLTIDDDTNKAVSIELVTERE